MGGWFGVGGWVGPPDQPPPPRPVDKHLPGPSDARSNKRGMEVWRRIRGVPRPLLPLKRIRAAQVTMQPTAIIIDEYSSVGFFAAHQLDVQGDISAPSTVFKFSIREPGATLRVYGSRDMSNKANIYPEIVQAFDLDTVYRRLWALVVTDKGQTAFDMQVLVGCGGRDWVRGCVGSCPVPFRISHPRGIRGRSIALGCVGYYDEGHKALRLLASEGVLSPPLARTGTRVEGGVHIARRGAQPTQAAATCVQGSF